MCQRWEEVICPFKKYINNLQIRVFVICISPIFSNTLAFSLQIIRKITTQKLTQNKFNRLKKTVNRRYFIYE